MTRPTRCPTCGEPLQLDLAGKWLLWRPLGFTAVIPASCTSCLTEILIEQVYVDGDRLVAWTVRAVV